MSLRITLHVNRKPIELRAVSLHQLSYLYISHTVHIETQINMFLFFYPPSFCVKLCVLSIYFFHIIGQSVSQKINNLKKLDKKFASMRPLLFISVNKRTGKKSSERMAELIACGHYWLYLVATSRSIGLRPTRQLLLDGTTAKGRRFLKREKWM